MPGQTAHGIKQNFRLAFGKHGSRFVQHQKPGSFLVYFPGNFRKLLVADGQLGNESGAVKLDIQL